ncbi:hypothetical protein B566_EDAN010827 [Ephemera danica]|nr:hypothetical protein B566_EDAN010827 [Ephemera danica]
MSAGDAELCKRNFKVGSRKSKITVKMCPLWIVGMGQKWGRGPQMQMSTTGDQILDKPLPKIGEKSLFTKELEIALEKEEVDFVVHSLKDLPTTLPPGMAIGAVCSVIGTSSLRRMAQIRQRHTHLVVSSIRGNLNTRLAKLEGSQINTSGLVEPPGYSALLLAAAGMERIGWKDKIGQILEPSEQLYAVGQGALAIECRANDSTTLALLAPLHDRTSVLRVVAERSLLKALGGGCSAPVAVESDYKGEILSLKAGVWSLDGEKHILREKSVDTSSEEPAAKKVRREEPGMFAGILAGPWSEGELRAAELLGEAVAAQLVQAGALDIMSEARAANEQAEEPPRVKTGAPPGRELCLAAQAAGHVSPH